MRWTVLFIGFLGAACSGDHKDSGSTPPANPPATKENLVTPPVAPPAPDAVMARIKAALPVGWTFEFDDTQLTIRRTEKLWSLDVNRINAPPFENTPAAQHDRIKKHGKEIHAELVYHLEPRWTDDRVADAARANAATRATLAELPKRHDVEQLRSTFSKGRDTYVGKTAAENQRIATFETERTRIDANIQSLPDCHTDRYSLFAGTRSGLADEFHLIYPEEAGQEVHAVVQMVKETCGGE